MGRRKTNRPVRVQQMSAEVDVVIIGAGAAGIAAMRRLAVSRLSSIVLEATARVGGRAWTCDVAGMRTRSGLRMAPFRRPQPMDSHCRRGRLCCRSSRSCVGPPVSRHRLLANGPGRREARLRCLGTADGVHAAQASDCAADALEPEGEWNAYLQAISSFMNGAGLEHVLGRRLYGL